MSGVAGFELDRSTERAWSTFQARLADHLAEMGEEDILVIDVEVADEDLPGAAPYVQFAGFGDGTMVRGEVSSSNYLAEAHELDEAGVAVLTDLGWHTPTLAPGDPEGEGSANFFVDVPLNQADRLAVMAVTALRQVFGVAHPAFLTTDGLGDEPDAPAPCVDTAPEAAELAAVMPESADHLRDLIDAALTPLLGTTPARDSDGDIPLPWGSVLVFVRVDEETPVVELFSVVVDGVVDVERAAFEVGVLNRDCRFVKFLLVEDRVTAGIQLPAWPFVPDHLRSMLAEMSTKLDEIDGDLARRVGGRCASEAGESENDHPRRPVGRPAEVSDETALTTLLQLDAVAPGVDPELAAGVCGFDQEVIVRLLRETEEQELAWRRARDTALSGHNHVEAQACSQEMRAWERTTSLLRRALRLVVERAVGRNGTARSTYSANPGGQTAAQPRRSTRRAENPDA